MKYRQIHNNSINQIMLIIIIILVCILIFTNLSYYLPGFLGAMTLYILFRNVFFRLTEEKKWNKPLVSLLFILITVIFIVFPAWGLISYITPQLTNLVGDKNDIVKNFNSIKNYVESVPILKSVDLSEEALLNALQKLTKYLPSILNSIAEVGVNLLVALFVLYFMLVNAKRMESTIYHAIPFSQQSKQELWTEVNMMVRSNAIGIPILALCQGFVAVLGYWLLGVENPIFWGGMTAISTIIPVLGTMTVYVPLSIFLLANGQVGNGIGLLVYGFVVIGGIDNVLRFTILKTLGNVPPLITVFGVLLGLKLFGMLGVIFGPLILSSVGVLLKVYSNEYGKSSPNRDNEPQIPT